MNKTCKTCDDLHKQKSEAIKDYDADKTAWNAPGAQWIRLLELRSLKQEIYESDQMIIRIIDERISVLENKLEQSQEEAMDRGND